jgi:hypothetical protein
MLCCFLFCLREWLPAAPLVNGGEGSERGWESIIPFTYGAYRTSHADATLF